MRPPPPRADPVDPTRVRTVPRHFAWIDHRLRDRLPELSLEAIALLLFLHLAADRTGCSFWADATIAKKLGLREGDISQARARLVARGLVAYRDPLYQLLPLEAPPACLS